MTINADYRELYGKFKFIVSIDGFDSAGFQTCSPIKVNIEIMSYAEGGALVPWKEAGMGSVDNVTLTRGMSHDRDMYEWILDVLDVMAKLPGGIGQVTPNYMRNLVVRQRQRDDTPATNFTLFWALPASWDSGDWNNEESGVKIESLEIAYHHPHREDV